MNPRPYGQPFNPINHKIAQLESRVRLQGVFLFVACLAILGQGTAFFFKSVATQREVPALVRK